MGVTAINATADAAIDATAAHTAPSTVVVVVVVVEGRKRLRKHLCKTVGHPMYKMILTALQMPEKINHALDECMSGCHIDAEVVTISIRDFEEDDACEGNHCVEVMRDSDYATPNVGVAQQEFEDGCGV